MSQTVAYRYDGRTTCGVDEYERPINHRHEVYLTEYPVLKHTPKGFWINVGVFYTEKRFVLRDARKKFAALDKATALESFIARKERQRSIYAARLAEVDAFIHMAKQMQT